MNSLKAPTWFFHFGAFDLKLARVYPCDLDPYLEMPPRLTCLNCHDDYERLDKSSGRVVPMLILIVIWLLALGVGGAYYGHGRWGLGGGAGVGIGTILLVLLAVNLLGVYR